MDNRRKRLTAEQVSEGVDLGGTNALVTGANTGLGLETARVLALRGARVFMACRDARRMDAARERIVVESAGRIQNRQLCPLSLDLASLDSVRDAAAAFARQRVPLHLLVNNAGVMLSHRRTTPDGLEAHFGINHLGHFLFTNLLLDPLHAAGGARVVILSSAAMAFARLGRELDDVNWERRRVRGMNAYGDSKLMNHLFARELHRRYAADGITANSLHPGVIATELGRDQTPLFKLLGLLVRPFTKTIPQGAATTVMVASDARYSDRGGLFFKDCAEARPMHPLACDDALAGDLWTLSRTMSGL